MRIRLIFFGFGGFALLAQMLLFREFHVITAGNELNFALFMGAWFISIALGAGWARPGLDRRTPASLYAALTYCAWSLALLLPLQVLVIRHWRIWIGALPGVAMSFEASALAMVAVVLPTGLAIGAAFPTGARWALFTDPHGVGRIYVAESLGALGAGLLFSFVLVGRLPALQMALLASGFLLAISALIPVRYPWGTLRLIAALAMMIYAACPPGWERVEQLSELARWRGVGILQKTDTMGDPGRSRWVAARDTPYQNLTLTERDGQYTVWANGNPAFVFPDSLAAEHAVHLMMAQKPTARQILMIGGNPVDDLPELLRYPAQAVTYLEPDPGVIRLIRDSVPSLLATSLKDPRVQWVNQDAVSWLRHQAQQYDVIWLQGDEPVTLAANRYYTREFFSLLRSRLAPGGVCLLAVESSEQLKGPAARRLASIVGALQSVFGQVICLPGSPTRIWVTATPGILTLDREPLAKRSEAAGLQTRFFHPDFIRETDLLDGDKIRVVRDRVSAISVPLNTVLRPQSCFESLRLRLYGEAAADGLERAALQLEQKTAGLKRILRHPLFWGGLLAALVVAIWGMRRRPELRQMGGRLAAGYAILFMGAMGMTLELMILVGYQNVEGVLYSRLGLLAALFMLGLALGAETVRCGASLKGYRAEWMICFAWVLMGLLSLGFPLLLAMGLESTASGAIRWGGGVLFFVLSVFAGWGVGLVFPAAWQMGVATGLTRSGSTAAWDALDHLGAAGGSLLTGVILIPVLGIEGTALILQAVSIGGLGLTVICLFLMNRKNSASIRWF
jgi:spermidine synthase